MAYEIVFGETGFDILEHGQVHSTGYTSREIARAAIRRVEKKAETPAYARAAVRRLCDSLNDEGADVVKVLEQERNWRVSSKN